MASSKSSFLDKVLGRIGRLDSHGLQTVVQRLARERSFLETLFNTIEDGVIVVDEEGRVLYFNHAVIQILGLPQQVEGEHISRFLPEFDWAQASGADEAGAARVVRQEFEVYFPKPRFLRLYAAPLDGSRTGSVGLALIIHDATEAREKTFAAIESERVQALTLLAGSVAHEIGNPLNALHIHLQLIEREVRRMRQALLAPESAFRRVSECKEQLEEGEEISHRMEDYVGVAKGEITRLDYIVTQFLEAIRPTPAQFALESVNKVVQDTLDLLRPEIENRGQFLEEKLSRQLPEVRLDRSQIKQVLVNIIKNAMQSMRKGGRLTVQTGATSDSVWVSVSDNGKGIPPDQLKRIFEPFFTTKEKGSGLGLMIVQRIIREHGGRIDLQSQVGKGTTFRIKLPLHDRGPHLLPGGPTGDEASTSDEA